MRNRTGATTRRLTLAAAMAVILGAAAPAVGVNVRDICHLQGSQENQLMAISLVVGLDGTGDGKSTETTRSLAFMLERFGHSGVTVDGISAKNVALVHVTATIPPSGAREGSKLDLRVASINGAKSLAGGRLIQCHMLGPMATPVVYALGSGEIVLDNPDSLTTATVKGGAVMERTVTPEVIAGDRITLVLDSDHATWAIASSIARIINDAEGEPGLTMATATGSAQVVVRVPRPELRDPADFIARVLDLPVLMPDLKARIVINRRTGTIVITGDVEIDPVTFTQRGLTVQTIIPPPVVSEMNPEVSQDRYQVFDPHRKARRTTARELTEAFNQLQVPIDDQIAIIWAIKRSGHLHAEVIEE